MKAIEYKGFLIEDNEGLMFIPFSKCPKIQITNISNCDSQMLYAENLEEAKEIINNITTPKKKKLKITKMKTVYQVSQKFSTETETEELLTKDFDNYQDAKDYFEDIKHEMQQGGDIVTDLVKYVYDEDEEIDWSLSDMDLDTFCNPYNYEQHYGKLVVMYMHTGKGMNYSHKFIDAFFLDKRSESRISENPDKRFTPWTTITELTAEDLEGLTYDEAVERVENEVNLKLTNRIDLSNLDLNFVTNED